MTETTRGPHAAPPGRARRPVVLGALLLLLAGTVAAQDMQIIDLQYRTAEQVIPILQPLLDPGDALTGLDDKLFLRASPAAQARIRQALEVVDRRPRQLTITVGQGTVREVDGTGVHGSATMTSGDVSVGVNRPPGADSSATVVVRDRQQVANLHNTSSVRVLEGNEAYISMGQSVPYTTTTVTPGWDGNVVQRSTTFRDASTGFYATPRLNGDTVTLVISPRQQAYEPARGGTIRTAGSDSIVTARLGEWIQVGAVTDGSTGSNGGLLTWGRYTTQSQYSAWLRVDETP
jgi:type II secretory pathway component GspD/PulD (secretin)